MYFKVSYDQAFEDLMFYLRSKYGEELFDLDGIGKQTDMNQFAKDFFTATTTADVSVDGNSNVSDRDVIAYTFELPKPFFRYNSYYLLWKKLNELYGLEIANKAIESQLTGDIYINDFSDVGRPYCFNYSTYDIMLEGLPMVTKIKSFPPKHLYSFKSQLEQFVVIAANSTLGATGLADLFLTMSYYVKKALHTFSDASFHFDLKEDVWAYVKETLVSFIYTINQPMRGNQSPFTNISIYDKFFLESLAPGYVFPDGSTPDLDIVNRLQELYLDVMNEELRRTPVTFPVTTACFSVEEDGGIKDADFLRLISEKNREFGFTNIYCGNTSTLSSCCRLRSEAKEYFNSFGAGSTKIGSLGVVTVNLPRIGHLSDSEHSYIHSLHAVLVTAAKINNAKREILKSRIEKGAMPLYTLGYMDLKKQYSTIGITGLNEALELLGYDILTKEGQDFALKIMDTINSVNDEFQKETGYPHNVEQVPAETSGIKLSAKDKFFDYEPGLRWPIYSNQFIPLTTNADMLDRIHIQGTFDKHFSGGAICHLNVGERIDDSSKIEELIKTCAKEGVVYFAINYNLQRCAYGHMSVGRNKLCPVCGNDIVDNFTRVVGFLTNTKNWSKERRWYDYPKRQFY